MSRPAWEFQYSTEIDASPEFAWQFWTDVANWKELEPEVEFELDGPFAQGAQGHTRMPGQEPRQWLIRSVDPGRCCVGVRERPRRRPSAGSGRA